MLGLFFLMLGLPFPLLLSLPIKSFVYMEAQRDWPDSAARNRENNRVMDEAHPVFKSRTFSVVTA